MEKMDELHPNFDPRINSELNKLLRQDIIPYTCQLLKQKSPGKLQPFASGVMAELGDAHYILTASHVIEDWSNDNKLFIEIEDGRHISIVGKGCATEIDKQEKLDIAYIKLNNAIVPALRRWYRFLPLSKFLHHEKVLHEAHYCVCGFPVSNPKKDGKTVGGGYFVGPSPDKVFEHYGFNPLSHYVLEMKGKLFNIETRLQEKVNTDHYGLSGGGLWYTTMDFIGSEKIVSKAHLIGIMIEFRKGKYYSLIANRVEPVLRLLHQNEGLNIDTLRFKFNT